MMAPSAAVSGSGLAAASGSVCALIGLVSSAACAGSCAYAAVGDKDTIPRTSVDALARRTRAVLADNAVILILSPVTGGPETRARESVERMVALPNLVRDTQKKALKSG